MKKWKIMLVVFLTIVAAVLTMLAWSMEWLATLGGTPNDSEYERMLASPNYDSQSKVFVNPVETAVMSSQQNRDTMLAWLDKPSDSVPAEPLPTVTPDFTPPQAGLKLTWMGHSTYVVQLDGKVFLTDPVFSDRASPSSLMGPKRFHPFPCDVEDLPELDAVLISHDHYDHLDYRAIRTLVETTDTPFLVPLGVGAHLREWGVPEDRILRHDWWDETTFGSVVVASTPARHFSGRKGYDQFSTLWTSWSIVGPEHRLFFSGDTGYFEGLSEIAEKYGPFDAAMYEIGAYHDNWGQIHLGPEKTIEANRLIGGELVIPIHWGTFDLGLHSWWEPPTQFVSNATAAEMRWSIPAIGASIVPGVEEPREEWWTQDD